MTARLPEEPPSGAALTMATGTTSFHFMPLPPAGEGGGLPPSRCRNVRKLLCAETVPRGRRRDSVGAEAIPAPPRPACLHQSGTSSQKSCFLLKFLFRYNNTQARIPSGERYSDAAAPHAPQRHHGVRALNPTVRFLPTWKEKSPIQPNPTPS